MTEEEFDRIFNLNVRGTLFTEQKALPLFRNGGSIVLNGSIADQKGMPGLSVYSGSKAALRAFARSWLIELKERRIRVNVLSPGEKWTGEKWTEVVKSERNGTRKLLYVICQPIAVWQFQGFRIM